MGGAAVKHPDQPDYLVGIVGCGAMGQGIAQVSVQGGMRTLLSDARDGGAAAAKEQIKARLDRLVEKGRLGELDAQAAADRLVPIAGLTDLAECDVVIEAVFEDLEVKQTLFRDLEAAVGPACILASNTSSIPLASVARVCQHRSRVAGLHFFNPVPLMKLVEVIRAAETSDQTVANLMALGRRMARTPVEVKDSPGFLVNMGGRAYTTEGNRIAHEGVATPAQIDAIMRDCWGFRMGPFELMDLTGIDVNYPVSGIIYHGYNEDPRLKTSANHMAMFDAGLYGRKTGQGWFAYENGQPKDRPSPDFNPAAAPVREVALAGEPWDLTLEDADPELADIVTSDEIRDFLGGQETTLEEVVDPETARLKAFCDEIGLTIIPDDGTCPLLAAPIGSDATHTAIEECDDPFDHDRLVCLDLTGDTTRRVTMMTTPGADAGQCAGVAAAIVASGRKVTLIKDSPGFVGQRMVAMIGNLGCYMAEIGLASPADIDTAMQLGLNYPRGSISLVEALGGDHCLAVLEALQGITGEDRYRPTLWLKRRVLLGLPIHTPN